MSVIFASDGTGWDLPLTILAIILITAVRIWLSANSGMSLLGGWFWQGGDGFGDARNWKPSPRPPRTKAAGPPPSQAGAAPRQLLDDSTGEITAQDLDGMDLPAAPAAALPPGRRLSQAEELELLRDRRLRMRRELPRISLEMHAQWEALADSMLMLEKAALAEPGNWDSPHALAPGAEPLGAEAGEGWADPAAAEQPAAGPLMISRQQLERHAQEDRNHNGVPDRLEQQRGQPWFPLSFSERAWRQVLEAEQGPGVLLTALRRQMGELAEAQTLMGFPLRLQGPLEEARTVLLEAFAACDERVAPLERERLRQQVRHFLLSELPRMRANLWQAEELQDRPF
ncbi:hypothetical protein IT575_09815 [bacterium]|nr:hypothetical protein [bacterium]